MLPGLPEKLGQQVSSLVKPNVKVSVDETLPGHQRRHGVWHGASVVAAHSSSDGQFQSKQDYEEKGPKKFVF